MVRAAGERERGTVRRRVFLASATTALTGCGAVGNALNASPAHNLLFAAESWNRALIGTRGMAKIYAPSDVDREFRTNGFDPPSDAAYAAMARGNFASYRLVVGGRVEHSHAFDLRQLRALATLDQITRHDCVEGWSAIGQWRGVPLRSVLGMVRPKADARYVIFFCMDQVDRFGNLYYESLDLAQAAHPQTVLALDLNGRPLDVAHGAPVRLRVPTQLGYKSAKWIKRIEVATTLDGNGGYWEDQGYEWYAVI